MPELPEVETVVRDLRPQLTGRRIESVAITRDRLVRDRVIRYPEALQFSRRLRGRTIRGVERRGKYIVIPLQSPSPGPDAAGSNGAAEAQRLIVHLGMTGHLRVWEPEEAPVKHTHFRAMLDSGLELRYDDPRQFGRLLLGKQEELVAARAFPARLGPEPIHGDLTEAAFETLIRSRRRPVKSALLDQSFLAGVGNIYAD
jgi:formamidopyrimidine-DNA glycosylase